MLKIGVLGAGHLGEIHLRCIKDLGDIYNLVGFYDPDSAVQERVSEQLQLKSFDNQDELISQVDVVDVVAPTPVHFDLIKKGLSKGKHVFTEKPVTESVEQAMALRELMDGAGVKVQVGHVERFNPAFQAVLHHHPQPMFVEGHRLAQFNPRGTDVSVVHDLMIHDIDILVALIPYPVVNVQASGVAVVSEQPDICNARIEFENGAVANLTASRISLKNMRKLRMFQRDAYLSVDFLEKKTEIVKLYDESPEEESAFEIELGDRSKWIHLIQPTVKPNNAIIEELRSFYNAIISKRDPDVTLRDALKSMQIAQQILTAIDVSANRAKI
jgi:predicted dehydrogenase